MPQNRRRWLHLARHLVLRCEEFRTTHPFALAVPDLLPEEADDVVAVCRLVDRKKPSYPYSFRYDPDARLHPATAEIISTHAPHGLTCVTFVLAVFRTAHVRLVDTSGWKVRDEDEQRYAEILSYFEAVGVAPAHLDRIRSDVKCIRVRPVEVAGACLVSGDDRPAGFEVCVRYGELVLRAFRGHAPP